MVTAICISSLSIAVDTDKDGLPDDWEIANGRDPLVADYMVSAGAEHSCALDDTGVVCWGYNNFGERNLTIMETPIGVPTLTNPTQVSAGLSHTCALDDSGVVCWGINDIGQTNVPALSNPTQVSAGSGYTCALDDSGVVCWGLGLGVGELGQTNVPALSNPT